MRETDNDVLVDNLEKCSWPSTSSDFNGVTVGGEWLFGLGRQLDAGLGSGLLFEERAQRLQGPDQRERRRDRAGSQAAHRAVHGDGPVPAARPRGGVQPYIGAGVGVFAWRYSETGEFVDFTDGSIFRDSFSAAARRRGR